VAAADSHQHQRRHSQFSWGMLLCLMLDNLPPTLALLPHSACVLSAGRHWRGEDQALGLQARGVRAGCCHASLT
jgi:hypothetical protein